MTSRLALVCAVFVAACHDRGATVQIQETNPRVRSAQTSVAASGNENTVAVPVNAIVVIDGTRFSSGNLWDADFVGEDGKSQHGNTAAIWCWPVNDTTGERTHIRVHEGQSISCLGTALTVVAVNQDGVILQKR